VRLLPLAGDGARDRLRPLSSVFGWQRRGEETRRFRKPFIEVARKNGKTLLAAVIGLYCLLLDGESGA
jgi:phage terminase large subunit-like protein